METEQQDSLIEKKLWISSNFLTFQEEQRKNQLEQMAGTNKYKKYVRFMKKSAWSMLIEALY